VVVTVDFNIVFKLSPSTISISQIKKDVDYKSLNNTNIIDLKDLKFSKTYIKENFELVSNFLNLVIIKNNITKVQINNLDIALVCLDLINSWEHIETLIFKPDKKLSYDIFLKLLDNNHLKEIDCFELPQYLLERLDMNKNIKVKTRNKLEIKSRFTIINNLVSYSHIYYKKYLVISTDFDTNDLEDFKTFMHINAKVKNIKLVTFSNEIITTVIKEIVENKKENITIIINEKSNDLNTIYNTVAYLKKSYHKYFEEYNINFKLNYSKEYKHKNFFKEINFKIFTTIILFIIIFSASVVTINYYQQYQDQNKIDAQILDLENILKEAEEFVDTNENETDVDYIDVVDNTETTTKKKSNYVSSYYTNFEQVFETLLKKNNDTVGWIQINNTKVNYPVVQADSNSYYLNRDYFKKKNSMGWIFMDYRNNIENLDRNTIIYGHNIKQGIMFGTIKNMMNKSWYSNANNQLITFNTLNKNMKWKIFSLYQINETEDYLKTEFESDDDYMNFLNMLKNRSKNNFNVELTPESKILTLSTCFSHTTRHVVHAVLVEE
jgi:sortase B